MKKVIIAAICIFATTFFSGCAMSGVYGTGHGVLGSSTLPVCATSNTVGSKVGTATMTNIIGIGMGDASIETAAKNGGITKIATVDVKGTNILGLYSKTTVIVTGE